MSARITGGTLRGRQVPVPEGKDLRPTSSMAREALFSMIGQALHGWQVVDLFGGSGLMAFEAASRGASPVIVVERDPKVVRAIRRAADGLGVSLDLRQLDARRFVAPGPAPIDLLFMDPPYRDPPGDWLQVGAALKPRWLVIEHRAGARLPREAGELLQDRVKVYGGSALAIYRPRPQARVEEAQRVAEDLRVIEDDRQPGGPDR